MKLSRLAFLALASCLSVQAADYYAAPTGSPSCDGTPTCAWDLQTALTKPLIGGDRLLLTEGTYKGAFSSSLNGAGVQIQVLPYSGAHPRIDGSLSLGGGYVTVQGLEFFSSNTNRTGAIGTDCLYTGGPFINLVHNVIHDCGGDGVGFWSADPNGVAYGNLVYYNGYNDVDRGHGHGFYTQSNPGDTKLLQDNVVLNQFGWGLHGYTEGGFIDGITYRGNVAANNGSLATVSCAKGGNNNILLGGAPVAFGAAWDSNYSYYPSNGCVNANLGYIGGTSGARLTNNWLIGSTPLQVVAATGLVQTGTVSYNWKGKKYPVSTCIVRPDLYEAGRALLVVINLSGSTAALSCDVSAIGYASGAQVQVASAEDYFGARRTFTVSAGKISLSVTGWTVAAPIGWAKPASMLPKFGVFISRASF
jgi:hypothetical protein